MKAMLSPSAEKLLEDPVSRRNLGEALVRKLYPSATTTTGQGTIPADGSVRVRDSKSGQYKVVYLRSKANNN